MDMVSAHAGLAHNLVKYVAYEGLHEVYGSKGSIPASPSESGNGEGLSRRLVQTETKAD